MKRLILVLLPLLAIGCARQPLLPLGIEEKITMVHFDDPIQVEVTRQYFDYLQKLESEISDPDLRAELSAEAGRNYNEFIEKRQKENAKS